MKFFIQLTHDEVQEKIPYSFICETMCSAMWNTGKRKRLMKQIFTENEVKKLSCLKQQAYTWTCIKGVPFDGVKMSINTLLLWEKLTNFCMML